MKAIHHVVAAALLASVLAAPVHADDEKVPYWASLRAKEATLKDTGIRMRVGPGESYRILWVFRRALLPVKVLRRQEGWRLVEDPDGARGWIAASFLARTRGAIVRGSGLAEMRDGAGEGARLLWRIEPGASGQLGDCDAGWCELDVAGHKGFIAQSRLWGAGEP